MRCNIDGSSMAHLNDDLYVCSQCSLVSSTKPPDKSQYDKSYVIKYKRYEHTETGEKINAHRFNTVRKYANGKLKLLDYGCGVGSFVRAANINGMVSHGFDINPFGDYCNPDVLFDRYDVVTFWDSIEHLEDPAGMLRKMNPQYVFLCTPCLDDWRGKLSDMIQWRHYMPEEHLHYFTERSLWAFFEACGYEVIHTDFDESQFRTGGGAKNIITMGGKKRG